MNVVCERRIKRLEQQLRCYRHAYDAQREVLFELNAKLQAAETVEGAALNSGENTAPPASARSEEKGMQMSAVVPTVEWDEAFRKRLLRVLRDPLEQQQAVTFSTVASHDTCSDDANPLHGDQEIIMRSLGPPRQDASIRNGDGGSSTEDDGDSPPATRLPSARHGSKAMESEQLTASLVIASTDAATRFLEMMRRLWSAYFAHMHSQLQGVLRRMDENFARFDANPSEKTLVEFLEAHQRLRPHLSGIFGMPEGEEKEEKEGQPRGAALPSGNPLEQEGVFVQQLSLCIAEAVSPLLALALRSGNNGTQVVGENHDEKKTQSSRRRRHDGHRTHAEAAVAPPPVFSAPFSPSRSHSVSTAFTDAEESMTESLKPNRDASQEELLDSHNGNRTRSSGESTTGSSEGRNSRALDVTGMGPKGTHPPSPVCPNLVRNDRKTDAGTPRLNEEDAENYPPQRRWRRDNDSLQVEALLYSRGSSASMRSPLNGPAAASTAHRAIGEEEEVEVGGAATRQNPHTRLRRLRMQEKRLSFTLIDIVAQRHDYSSEAKCYAVNKRLARVRSAIIRTEREVNELRRIQEEKEAIRKERAARQRRLLYI
ncbi:hypothetical protein C4B63_243g11 [Trypanosoma cruzi]|uniref:Uncharacterized protein n=1 Tax=Trypanosoma cruzi TaxID=5693 RepID=A0A2V2UJP5_TRYCR|nr:hypothetical protein C4B63_243g11 [Trypanosoma cruzi]